jgi:TolB-like protein
VTQIFGAALGTGPPGSDECRLALERILKSPEFSASDRDRRFLEYVVNEALAGRANRIKAYSIALEVFGRDSSFDAQNDPIVRVEAGHLRRALERYYLTAGQADPVFIVIPKGSYVPTFKSRGNQPSLAAVDAPPKPGDIQATTKRRSLLATQHWLAIAAAAIIVAVAATRLVSWNVGIAATTPNIPRLLVQPFEDLTGKPDSAFLVRGLTQEVVGQIARFKDLIVVEAAEDGKPVSAATSSAPTALRYALTGSVRLSADNLNLQVRVLSRGDGSVLWADSYDGDLRVIELRKIEADVARQVATALAQPYGVIFQADASRHVDNPPDDWEAYACTLAYYAYRANLDAKSHPAVRKCLEQAVARFPGYATAWALLSQTYVDEVRFRYPIEPSATPASTDRALAAARRAVELDPQNVRGLQAEMFALYFAGDRQAALKVGEQAVAVNPNDTEFMGEYGYRLALSGDWARGCPLVAQARERNPGPLAYYESALALCAYISRDYAQAAMWIKKTAAPENPNYHLIAAEIFGEGGFTGDAERERDWLLKNAPDLVTNVRSELAMRIGRTEDVDRFIASLRKAGLTIPN